MGCCSGDSRRCGDRGERLPPRHGVGLAESGALGDAFSGPAAGYIVVYQIEIVLLFATLVVIGPMVRSGSNRNAARQPGFGLAHYPG